MRASAKRVLQKLDLHHVAYFYKELLSNTGAVISELRALKALKVEAAPMRGSARKLQTGKRVLILGFESVSSAALHAVLLGGFRTAGYEPVVVLPARSVLAERAYRAMGVRHFAFVFDTWQDDRKGAARAMANLNSIENFLALTHRDCRVGQAALSGLMRQLRVGEPDLRDPATRAHAELHLARSLAATKGLTRIFGDLKPDAVVVTDRYTPAAQLFDMAVGRGVPVITLNAGHRNNILMLKRYGQANREAHPFSLSEATWERLCAMPWDEDKSSTVMNELEYCYRSGEWFSEVGTQFNTQLFDRSSLLRELGFSPDRKTAVVFPHIFWDGTFFWGRDIFPSYEEWFVKTITHAADNTNLNWVIKVHPANRVKDIRDGYQGAHNEVQVIMDTLAEMPAHIHVLPADSPISTLSLFTLADYCLTVRGTVGMEAACFGIPVVTAGTGRYDRKGFTIDPQSMDGYSDIIAHLHELDCLSEGQVKLARRFAYGALLCRPLPLEVMGMAYAQDDRATLDVSIRARSEEEFFASDDVRALASWIESSEEDFLVPGCAAAS